MSDRCAACGAQLALVGKQHRCVPSSAAVVANGMARWAEAVKVANTTSTTYRYRNADQRRAYMRAYMARRRAAV